MAIKQSGDFKKLEKFLKRMNKADFRLYLEKYGQKGVAALSSATPVDSGETASSWGYEVHRSGKTYKISWTNSHMEKGVVIAILIQYGHGTRNGGYVQGRDFINPAIRPVFDRIAEEIWKEVTSS